MDKITNHDVSSILAMYNQAESLNFFMSNSSNDINNYFSTTPHILSSLVVGLCICGSARMRLDTISQDLESNQLIFLLPNTIVEPIEVSKDFRMHSIIFDFDFIASLPMLHKLYTNSYIRHQPIVALEGESFSFVEQLFTLINQSYYREEQKKQSEVLSHLLSALISEISRFYLSLESQHRQQSQGENITERFLTLLYKYYTKEREVRFYADKLNISTKYLTTVVRKHTGKPISEWINEFVIAYAKSLLKSSNNSITQITDQLGFTEPTSFARFFKRYTASTPSEYRKNN